jgi:SAM-dependent methyltransferase
MPDAVARFSSFAAEYDAARPTPPAALVQVILQWAGTVTPDVVDLDAGTGLSTVIWAGHTGTVTAVEPSAEMRALASRRIAGAARDGRAPAGGRRTEFALSGGTAETTGLPDGCADIVTASQAMHWFDADRALPEIARLLRPGGVLAAYDCDWPPCIDWEADAAYEAAMRRIIELENARGLSPPHGQGPPAADAAQRAVPLRRRDRRARAGARRRRPAGRDGTQPGRRRRAARRRRDRG